MPLPIRNRVNENKDAIFSIFKHFLPNFKGNIFHLDLSVSYPVIFKLSSYHVWCSFRKIFISTFCSNCFTLINATNFHNKSTRGKGGGNHPPPKIDFLNGFFKLDFYNENTNFAIWKKVFQTLKFANWSQVQRMFMFIKNNRVKRNLC